MAKQVEEEHTWQSCAKWLCALDILPSNHKVMMPDATLRDLAYTLRDGVLLCNIVTGKSLFKQKKIAGRKRPALVDPSHIVTLATGYHVERTPW